MSENDIGWERIKMALAYARSERANAHYALQEARRYRLRDVAFHEKFYLTTLDALWIAQIDMRNELDGVICVKSVQAVAKLRRRDQ